MCRPASMIVTKTKVLWSEKTDSHEDIIEEFSLKEKNVRNEVNFVRVEICPPDGDLTLPKKQWKYQIDQDLIPNWYDAEEAEKAVRLALPDWIKRKVLKKGEHIIKDRQVYAYDNSTVNAYNNSSIEAYDRSTVKAYDRSTVISYNNLKKNILMSTKAVLINRSKVTIECFCGNGRGG